MGSLQNANVAFLILLLSSVDIVRWMCHVHLNISDNVLDETEGNAWGGGRGGRDVRVIHTATDEYIGIFGAENRYVLYSGRARESAKLNAHIFAR